MVAMLIGYQSSGRARSDRVGRFVANRRQPLSHRSVSCENALSTIDERSPEMSSSAAETVPLCKWMCVVCGFIYDEAVGVPEEGLAPGTRWADVPDTWTCPDCGATKDDFEMIEID